MGRTIDESDIVAGIHSLHFMPTSTVEDYLKAILRRDEEPGGGSATVGVIADDLGVTPGTVSSMMRHLSEAGLVDYVPRRSVALLPAGRAEALRVVRRHRLIEAFLVEVMHLDWSEVHEEAEVLEHAVSDRLLARMDEMLGYPSHDPHGDPIPDDSGNIDGSDREAIPLSAIDACRVRIVRVEDSDAAFLDWLRGHGLQPGCEFEVVGRDVVAGVTEVRRAGVVRGKSVRLGEKAAARIFVCKADVLAGSG